MSAASPIVWQPNEPLPGCYRSSQELWLSCPAWEALIEGGRGSGKTAALLMDFASDVGRGWGPHWRGILFRETYGQLEDLVAKSQLLYRKVFPEAKFNASDLWWEWPTGEKLLFSYLRKPADYWHYHGWELPWIGFEELCNWPTNECYELMKGCSRSSHPGIPLRIRSNTNSWGKGYAWVKAYWVDPAPAGVPIQDPKTGQYRVRIYAPTEENRALHDNDTTYLSKLEGIQDENLRKAWRGKGNRWDIASGSYFAADWHPATHVLEPFKIPFSWRVDRAFDWGSSKPFSVGWYAESDGTEAEVAPGKKRAWPRGSLFRIAEWYGWSGKPDEGLRMLAENVGKGVLEREKSMVPSLLASGVKPHPGPADSSIWDEVNGKCIEADMRLVGCRWERADKSPGSRRHGWEQARKLLAAARDGEGPGFFVFSTCRHFIRTVPVLPRDERDPDDVDSDAEDHIADEWRYRLLAKPTGRTSRELANY